MKRLALAATAATLLAVLPGCEAVKQHVNGDAGMRIQVDVYKGPLAMDPEVQWGRLLGYLQEANTSIDHYIKQTMEILRTDTGTRILLPHETHPYHICRKKDWKYKDYTRNPETGDVSNQDRLIGEVPLANDVEQAKQIQEYAAGAFKEGFSWAKLAALWEAQANLARANNDARADARKLPRHVPLLLLIHDACEAWSFINRQQASAIYWTQNYDQYRGQVAKIFDAAENQPDRVARQVRLLTGPVSEIELDDNAEASRMLAQSNAIRAALDQVDNQVDSLEKVAAKLSESADEWKSFIDHVTRKPVDYKYSQQQLDRIRTVIGSLEGASQKILALPVATLSPEQKEIILRNLRKLETNLEAFNKTFKAEIRKGISTEQKALEGLIDSADEKRDALRGLLSGFSEISSRMKAKAAFWTWHHAILTSKDHDIRQVMLALSLIMSEYSNRIGSASDALVKQTYIADRREMPISELIRDTRPTHIANLLIFNNAIGERLPHEALDSEFAYDRLRTIEQTYGDESWSNINQAYASGRGDVAMAFIKDGIGNWNLKSFSQDPTEVIKAYKDLGLAALKTAVTAASGGSAEGLSRAQKLLALGNQLATGGPGAVAAPEEAQVRQLRQSAIAELELLAAEAEVKSQTVTASLDLAQQTADSATAAHTAAYDTFNEALVTDRTKSDENSKRLVAEALERLQSARENKAAADASLADAKSEAANLSKLIAAKAKAILASHARIITTLQSSLVETKTPAVPAEVPRLN